MKHDYTLRVEGKLELKQVGNNINTVFPFFFQKAKAFYNTVEGLTQYVEWLRNIPENSEWAKYKEELPMWEAKLKEMGAA